ncbi:MAG TPA: hypothetical protein VI451_04655, partial [Anaerolineales bacterium]|nr:hypothetical protein [Anaerolineales bacterium]
MFVGRPDCLPFQEGITFEAGSLDDYSQAILAYLNDGGIPDDLTAVLNETGGHNQSQVAVADFSGDGLNDLGVSYFDLTMETPESLLNIFVCQDGHYALVYQDGPGAEGFFWKKQLWVWQDLDANGTAELVASDTQCGAHTCFANVKILAWDGRGFVNKLTETTDDLPSPEVQVTDADGDGVFELEVAAGGIASVGARPQRSLTRVWIYDPVQGIWAPDRETLGLSNFRLHALHDADAAAKRGDYETALALYERVIN